jgi:NAD(P)-dependent dehydrogenase (short-subunit alcohol dehydrogenase family)
MNRKLEGKIALIGVESRHERVGSATEGRQSARPLGRVDEIAAMVAFVAGPESSYITGANLTVDGGMNA